MVQKKTAELQGFHRSFKVRAGLVWEAPQVGPPEWPVEGRGAYPQDLPGLVPRSSTTLALALGLPHPCVHRWGNQRPTVQSYSPWVP